MESKINVKQEQRIGKFVRDFSIVVQDERSVNYNILRNMLRELLNSQDQEEERKSVCDKHHREVCEDCMRNGSWTFEDTPEEKKTLVQLRRVFDKKRVKEWDRIAMETYKQATQSTPEQKEEWEKKWEEFFLYVTNNKNWVDGRPEWKGNVYITLYNAMKDFIRQLLEEGERWAIDTFLKDTASYNSFHNGRPRIMRNGLSGEGFEVRVSKLTTK